MKNLSQKSFEKLNKTNFEIIDTNRLSNLFGGMVESRSKDKEETVSATREGFDYHKRKSKD